MQSSSGPRPPAARRVGPHIAGVAVRQIEDEEVRLARHTPDHRTRLTEVRLPMARRMDQRHEHLPPPAVVVVLAHIVLHDRVAAAEPVLGAKPVEDTLGRVALLAGLVGIVLQPLVDDLGEPVQLRAPNPVPSVDSPEAPKSTASSSRSRAKSRNDAPPHARSSRPGRRDGPSDKVPRYACPRPPRRREGSSGRVLLRPQRDNPPLPWTNFAPPCAFRRKAATEFQSKAATDSDLIRPPILIQSGQSGWRCDRPRWVILTGATFAPFERSEDAPGEIAHAQD